MSEPHDVEGVQADYRARPRRRIIAAGMNGAVLIVVILIFVALILALAKSLYF